MFRTRHFVILATAAAMMLSLSSCKKSNQDQADQAPVVAQQALSNWDKSVVNGLLNYIPADSPFVYISTRQFDISSPSTKYLLAKSGTILNDVNNLLKDTSTFVEEKDKEIYTKLQGAMVELAALVNDYQKNAPSYGLNPEHIDYVVYMDGTNMITKFTVDDGAKAKEKLATLLKTLQSPNLEAVEIKSGEDSWDQYAVKIDDIEAPITAVHYDKNIVTIAYSLGKIAPEDLARFLKEAPKPLTKDAFGKIDNDVSEIGYIDTVTAMDKILSGAGRKNIELLTGELPAECDPELKEIVVDYPRIKLTNRIQGEKTTISDVTLVFKDKENLKSLQELHIPALNLVNSDSLLGVSINIGFKKLLDTLVSKSTTMVGKTYKCEILQKASSALFKELPAVIMDPESEMLKNYVSAINGISAVIGKIDLPNKSFEVAASVSGTGLAQTIPSLLPLVSNEIPALAGLTANAEAPIDIDLSAQVGVPITVKAYMTDTALVAGTPSYDVKTLSTGAPKDNKTFLELSLSSKILGSILGGLEDIISAANKDSDKDKNDELRKDIQSLYEHASMQVSVAVGSNDEGLTGQIKMEL